jgi:hypothetical protein
MLAGPLRVDDLQAEMLLEGVEVAVTVQQGVAVQ